MDEVFWTPIIAVISVIIGFLTKTWWPKFFILQADQQEYEQKTNETSLEYELKERATRLEAELKEAATRRDAEIKERQYLMDLLKSTLEDSRKNLEWIFTFSQEIEAIRENVGGIGRLIMESAARENEKSRDIMFKQLRDIKELVEAQK